MKYLWFIACLSLFFLYLGSASPRDGRRDDLQLAFVVTALAILGALLMPLPGTASMDEAPRAPVRVQSPPPVQQEVMVRGMY